MAPAADQPDTDRTRARLRRFAEIAAWLVGIALLLFVLNLLGVPVAGWIKKLFHEIRSVPAWAIVAGVVLDTVQTVGAALAWLTILRAAFPNTVLPFRTVLAAYAVAVALNGFLPANIGTLVMMLMFTSVIAGATFAAIFSGFVVQKIPFSIFAVASYLYLFFTVGKSLSVGLNFVSKHPALTVIIVVGAVVLLALLVRIYWRRAAKLRQQLKNGGAILGQPRRFMLGVALPELVSYLARLGIIAVFMAAYSIPVTFHSVISVSASNSVSNSVSATPGGVGVTQALNVAVLGSSTTKETATAYSLAQQLIITAWDVLFAIILVAWVFGWSGGKDLIRESYSAAQVKEKELREQRRAKREARPARRWRPRRSRGAD